MTRESFVALVGNAALLLSLVYVYDLLNVVRWVSRTWIRQLIAGLAIGANGIFVMLMPWTFETGIIFDTRSVLLAVSGLFFGTIPTVVAVLMTAALRLLQGGGGAWTGVSVIIASGAIGVAWRHARQRQLASLSFRTLYALGLVVHVVMLALMFTQPPQKAMQILGSIALPVLVIYPIATAAYGTLMVNRLRREESAAAVRESESKFRALFEQAAFGVAKIDVRTGGFALVNQHYADLLGYTREELLAMDIQAITHPDDLAAIHRNMQELASGRVSSFVLVKRYVRKDGGVIWANVTVSRLWSEGDEPDFMMAAIEDVTDRKNAQEALVASQAKFHELYENMTSGCAICSVINDGATGADYIVSNFNRAALRMQGKTINEVVGTSLRDLWPRIDDYGLVPVLQEVWHTGRPAFFPVKVYEDKRFFRWHENYVFRIPSGEVVTIYDDVTDRKRAEDALAVSEERYRTLFESMDIGVLYFAPDDTVISANPAAEDILGVTLGEIVGRRPMDPRWRNIHEDSSEFPRESLPSTQAMHTGEAVHDVIIGIFNQREEAYRWVRINAIPQFRADETSPYQVYVTMEDITERKRAEEETQRERAFFDRLVETTPEGIAITDTKGRVTRMNAEFVRMFGYGADEAVGQCIDDLVAPPAHQEEARAITTSTGQGENVLLETVRRRKDGSLVDVSLIVAPILIAGRQEAVYAIYRDITERKRAEEALKASEERLRAVVTNVPLVLFAIGADGVFILSEGHGLSRLGLQPGEVVGKSVFDVYRDVPSILDNVRRAMNGGTLHENVRVGDLWFESWYTPVRGLDGLVTGIIGVSADVTERVLAEETHERIQAQLLQSQKMEAIGELAGGIAHDFNNMLTGILGNVAIVQEGMSADDPLAENVDAIGTAAREAANLTRDLLSFSRGAMVQPVPLDTNASVERTLAVLKQSLPASVTIVSKLQPDVWNVYMDQTQMTQILLNLGVNARDAMEGRGILTISTGNTVVDAAYLGAHPFARHGEFVVLSVADAGPGIPAEVLPHIFEPFFTTKSVGSGTGLGLAIVYGAVKQAGGWITAQSDSGEGTLFEVYLPRWAEGQLHEAVATSAGASPCVGTVLVVEDEPVVSAVAQALLTRSGCAVLTARDGTSALATFRAHPGTVDLILLDMTMPGMTTQEIVPAFRALSPSVPILLTSGYTSGDTVKRMLDEGTVQGFLPKPYEVHELLDSVQKLLRRE
ncbi:MAG: PAS domain S-box protein [Caldiserica bacterium]|nr:PAS domain S-box protein [Caldisericota bacterium]